MSCLRPIAYRSRPIQAVAAVSLAGLFVLALAGCRTAGIRDDISGNLFSKGGINVRTQPSGAIVTINEKRIGRAPLTRAFRPGIYRVVVEKRGYETQDLWVEVPKGKTADVLVQLERR